LKRWASEVAKEILLKEYDPSDPSDPSPLGGHLSEEIERECKKLFCNKTFTPANLLRAMDFHGATLSYSGIEVLRMVETEGEKHVKVTTLPCSADMGRWARVIEAFNDTKMPFKVGPWNG
jgi:hypothetical protein